MPSSFPDYRSLRPPPNAARHDEDHRRCGGLSGTPEGTGTPNLLIRRSPRDVHRGPQPSIQPGTQGFHVHHRRPHPSTAVQSYWLQDWLPEQVTEHTYPVRNRRHGRFPIRAPRVLRSRPTRFDSSANPRQRIRRDLRRQSPASSRRLDRSSTRLSIRPSASPSRYERPKAQFPSTCGKTDGRCL
jgi:hypothetical protein